MLRLITPAVLIALATGVTAWSAEPLVGVWKLDRQEMNGEKLNPEPMVLKISQSGDQYTFAFSVPVNNVYFVSMSYTVRLDGSEGDVKNSHGDKIGTAKVTSTGAGQYKLSLTGPNRPESAGKLTVSGDGKTLTSESDTVGTSKPAHVMQVFSRN